MAQDLAWRTGEGVLRDDVPIPNYLLKFLIQGYITKGFSQYQYFRVYWLSPEGEKVFEDIMDTREAEIIENKFK